MSAGPGAPLRPGRPIPPVPAHARHRRRRARSFGAALGLSVVNAVLPGTAFMAVRRRWLGGIVLAMFLAAVAAAVWLLTGGQRFAARMAVDTSTLLWVLGAVAVGALAWIAVIVAGYLMLLPRPTSAARHVVGALLCTVLVLV